ncbi:MAG: hypothetical protein ACLQKH_18005 [Steroidobacteraceae bacterium]
MLNALLKKLNGHGTEVESLEGALVQLARDREATQSEIREAQIRRHQALLDDCTDEALTKLERSLERAQVRLEKIDLAEPGLRDRLATAKTQAQKRAVERHFESIAGAYQTLRDAVLDAEAAQVALMRARDAAIDEVGEHAINQFPIFAYGGLLGRGTVQSWAAECDRILEQARASRRPRAPAIPDVTAAPAPRPTPPKARESLQHPIHLQGGVEVHALTAARQPDDAAPLSTGQARVKVLRAGFSPADDRPQCHRGQVIRLPLGQAAHLESLGVAEIIERPASPTAGADKPNEGDSQNV